MVQQHSPKNLSSPLNHFRLAHSSQGKCSVKYNTTKDLPHSMNKATPFIGNPYYLPPINLHMQSFLMQHQNCQSNYSETAKYFTIKFLTTLQYSRWKNKPRLRCLKLPFICRQITMRDVLVPLDACWVVETSTRAFQHGRKVRWEFINSHINNFNQGWAIS